MTTIRTATRGRLWMRLISWQVLDQYMEFRGETATSLAEKAGVSRQIVGFLRTGRRTSCRPQTARAISEALKVLPESLFVPEVSIASDGTEHTVPNAQRRSPRTDPAPGPKAPGARQKQVA